MTGIVPDSWKPAGIVVLAAVLAGCNTYGTGVNPGKQTLSDLTGIVALGGRDKEPVEYAPRPPIVAPPTTDALPPPGTKTADPNWPRDPDEAARQRQFAAAQGRGKETQAEILADPGFRLPKSSNNVIAQRQAREDPSNATEQIFKMQGQKDEARQVFAAAKSGAAGAVDAEGNPVRTYLTEPPAEYRVPDPEAPEAFTAARDEKWWQIFRRSDSSRARSAGTGSQPINTNAGP